MDQIILKFPEHTQFTDDELFDFCATNDWFRIERNKSGQLIIMSPSGGITGAIHFKIYRVLSEWADLHEDLGVIIDASVGFRLSDKSVLAPDAAFVLKERWNLLTDEQKEKFPPLCPDFVIEVRSPSDSLPQLKLKMTDWINNGCRLAWLIDPIKRNAFVYTSQGLVRTVETFEDQLDGADVMPGLVLDLRKL